MAGAVAVDWLARPGHRVIRHSSSVRATRVRIGDRAAHQEHSAMTRWAVTEGAMLSPGPAWIEEQRAYNFTLYAQHAESVVLLLFGEDDPATPLLEYRL